MGAVGSVSHILLDVTTGLQSTCYVPTHTRLKVLDATARQAAHVAVKQSFNLACQRNAIVPTAKCGEAVTHVVSCLVNHSLIQ